MRLRFLFISVLAVFSNFVLAKDAYLSIGGSVGVFHTDARIFNPSSTKDIQIQAYLLPPGTDNSGVQPVTITVPKRQMVVYNDVVQSLFNSGVSLAAIRLKSNDDFVASQRIYALSSAGCVGTLGQFVPGLDVSEAIKQGVLIQLKSNGSFRTNIGLVNPNPTTANVTWHLYDKSNAVVGTTSNSASFPAAIQPFGVVTPINATTAFSAPGADLSDYWVSFSSDQPIFAYASVVDNGTTDPTFIPAVADSGAAVINTPTAKTFNVSERSFSITISPQITTSTLKPGDQVIFHITVQDSDHGFELIDPTGAILIPSSIFSAGQVIDKAFTVTVEGTYSYFCTNSSCGTGHNQMVGSFDVGQPTDSGPRY